MSYLNYAPIYAFTRGDTVESVHYGAIAVVDVHGNLVASYGDPATVTFLRSTAKPFQALPFIAQDGDQFYNLTEDEVAILCASHSGTDEHVAVIRAIQDKAGVAEEELLCGTHYPYHEPTANMLREKKLSPTPNRHNCSGKHTGMLAYVHMHSPVNLPYLDLNHPLQVEIIHTFADMCNLKPEDVQVGIDGCSAPNFAVPLYNAALSFARLCEPEAGGVQPANRVAACHRIVKAMTAYPNMVAGPDRFDTLLMENTKGKIVSKAGAEGYQGIGILPGALGNNSPALGIALKISDGDARGKVRSAISMEVLLQLGILDQYQEDVLRDFGPTLKVFNWRKLEVGKGYPLFDLGLEKFAGLPKIAWT